MQIHVVQVGESLSQIAQRYNLPVQNIVQANRINDPEKIVVGQAIIIPIWGSFYWVQLGDTLWSISQIFGINYLSLAQINGIDPNSYLSPGFRLYIPPTPKIEAEINAYIEPSGQTISQTLLINSRAIGPYLTYLAPFSYEARRDGTLQPLPLQGIPEIGEETRASLMMVITNLEEGEFNGELGKEILQSEAVQDLLLDNIIAEAKRVGRFSDVHFDFEFLPSDQRTAYNEFLKKAFQRLRSEGLLISSALAPKTSADQPGQWYEAHDYQAHGEIVDFVVLMTYEWGYSGGPPMAVSPIGPVREVIEYALTEMPASKIMMGQNLYGYDWTLPYEPGGEFAEAVSPQKAIERAKKYNVSIQYDTESQAPNFDYVDEQGNSHKVWFEDARSIQAKFDIVRELGLRGVSYWKLGLPFPQNWLLINENFEVVKR